MKSLNDQFPGNEEDRMHCREIMNDIKFILDFQNSKQWLLDEEKGEVEELRSKKLSKNKILRKQTIINN